MNKLVSAENKLKSSNQHIVDVINNKIAPSIGLSDYRVKPILNYLRDWAGNNLSEIFVAGSSAKGTALRGSSDLDLFVSLKASSPLTLEAIFNSLVNYFKLRNIQIRPQNVSVRIIYYGLQIDIVPGKKMPNQVNWHFLHTNRRTDQFRIQTNVVEHINFVLRSGRVNEIIALKIWREKNKLEFPSMYLEMYTIKALSGRWSGKSYLASNFLNVLDHIGKYFHSTAIYDPSNGNNVISNSLYKYEKDAIQRAALNSLKKEYLNQIIY